jgi:hypothetical protein
MKVTGGRKKLNNEEFSNLYASPNFIAVIKSRMIREAGHAPCMEEITNAFKILVVKT